MTTEPTNTPPTERELCLHIAHTIGNLGLGDLSQLRRLDVSTPHAPAFWRLLALHLDASLPADETARAELEGRWAVIAAAMAEAHGFHRPSVHLGVALANVVDERRVLQLLRSHGTALADGVRVVVHHLVSRAQGFDHSELARLVLSDGRADEGHRRRKIYRDFFAAMPRE